MAVNILKFEQYGLALVDDIFKYVFFEVNVFLFKFHWSLYLRIQLRVNQQHNLNQR